MPHQYAQMDSLGDILDLRDKKTCPSFRNLNEFHSSKVHDLTWHDMTWHDGRSSDRYSRPSHLSSIYINSSPLIYLYQLIYQLIYLYQLIATTTAARSLHHRVWDSDEATRAAWTRLQSNERTQVGSSRGIRVGSVCVLYILLVGFYFTFMSRLYTSQSIHHISITYLSHIHHISITSHR